MNTSILALCLTAMTLVGYKNPVRDPIDSVIQVVTDPQQEIQRDRRQHRFAVAQLGGDLTQFPLTINYLNDLVQRLAKTAYSPFPWEIRLINEGSIDSWALPGDKIRVDYGVINVVETEAELVSVLSHEMAHSIELHGTGRETFDWFD